MGKKKITGSFLPISGNVANVVLGNQCTFNADT
jgi:hypothetical protein